MARCEIHEARLSDGARWRVATGLAVLAAAWLATGCGSGGGSSGSGGAVELPPLGSVSGLVVAAEGFPTRDSAGPGPAATPATGALGGAGLAPPSRFTGALSGASWEIEEAATGGRSASASRGQALTEAESRGTTAEDGTFALSGLPPGEYEMRLAKTVDGNLLEARVPLHIGTESGTAVLVQLTLAGYRTISRYLEDGALIEAVRAADGSRRTTRDGRLAEVVLAGGATYRDTDGDGTIDDCAGVPGPTPPRPDVPPGTAPVPLPASAGAGASASGDAAPPAVSPSCPGGPIVRIEISAYLEGGRLFVGQTAWLQAIGYDEAGNPQDVTQVAEWASSRPSVAEVDEWGVVLAKSTGSTRVTAGLGSVQSEPFEVEVAPRPPLTRLVIQNQDCVVPYPEDAGGGPGRGPTMPEPAQPPDMPADDPWYPPQCLDIVEVGGARHYAALGEFEGGLYEDVTQEVKWGLEPSSVASISQDGTLEALAPGKAKLSASLEGVSAESIEVTVVAEPTLVSIEIYTDYPIPVPVPVPGPVPIPEPAATAGAGGESTNPNGSTRTQSPGGDVPSEPPGEAPAPPAPPPEPVPPTDGGESPCKGWRCVPVEQVVLSGDTVQFHALGHYDTGLSQDLTASATWSSSHPAVGLIGPKGLLQALLPGETEVRASLGKVQSGPFTIRVVREASVLALWLEVEGTSRILKKGGSLYLHATATYDVGSLVRDVTGEVTWVVSDPSVAEVAAGGELKGKKPGRFTVLARIGGVESGALELEVWEASDLDYCDEENVNHATWTDGMNRVLLETDCATYDRGATVQMRYTIQEIRPNPGALLDPCLDLYVYRGEERIRTIREQGCGRDVLPDAGAAPADETLYQTLAFWDQKDSEGRPVGAATYTIVGRFYIYYDPVVRLDIRVE